MIRLLKMNPPLAALSAAGLLVAVAGVLLALRPWATNGHPTRVLGLQITNNAGTGPANGNSASGSNKPASGNGKSLGNGNGGPCVKGAVGASGNCVFTLTGSISGLVPGADARTLELSINNPNPWPLHVLTVAPKSISSANPSCLPSWLSVSSYDSSAGGPAITVPAGADGSMTINVRYLDDPANDQTPCELVPYTISLMGTAEAVPGR